MQVCVAVASVNRGAWPPKGSSNREPQGKLWVEFALLPRSVGRPPVNRPIMQTIRHILPEFERFRKDTVSGPISRSRNVIWEASLRLGKALLQNCPLHQRTRLSR